MADIPLPKASPQHPKPARGDTQPGVASIDYVKRKLKKWAAIGGFIGGAIMGAVSWWHEHRSDEKTQAVDESSLERMVKLEQKLSDHIDAENQRWLSADAHQQKSDAVQAVMNAKLDMELDRHGVPKARRPQVEDFEPAGPPGETK